MRVRFVRGYVSLATLGLFLLNSTVALDARSREGQAPGGTKSPALVQQLAKAMADSELTSVAARHPEGEDRYVAAMLFPGVQLLLITARSTAPAYVESKLSARDDASVYAALHQGVAESKFFVHDMGGDGLTGAAGGVADILYLQGKDQRIIDGDHKAAGLSAADYAKLVRESDQRYAELLAILLEAVRARKGMVDPPIQPAERRR